MTNILDEFDKKFVGILKSPHVIETFEGFCEEATPKNIKQFISQALEAQKQEWKEQVLKCLPKEKELTLEEPQLRQYDSKKNEMGGYSSVPFYCSLCSMGEMDIQDNKLENGNYVCNCSVWDNSCGGKWVKWSDIEEAKQILKELPCEENFWNACLNEIKKRIEERL